MLPGFEIVGNKDAFIPSASKTGGIGGLKSVTKGIDGAPAKTILSTSDWRYPRLEKDVFIPSASKTGGIDLKSIAKAIKDGATSIGVKLLSAVKEQKHLDIIA